MATVSKNWHWRSKGVEAWAKDWFTSELTGTTADGVTIDSVSEVEGDAELGMRKSKLVTIYDQKITMIWKATDTAGEEVNGTLVAVEVSHDMDEDDYVFTASLDSTTSKEAEEFLKIAKKALANKLRTKFQKFPKAIIDTHGKDLLVDEGDSAPTSGVSTPSTLPKPSSTITSVAGLSLSSSSNKTSTTTGTDGKTFNTATVKAEGEFQCSASDLFSFLTDETKIPMWSRNPAQMKAEVGAVMSLFGGNIAGKVTTLDAPNSITTTWRAPTWPEGYYGSLETTLKQGSNSTNLVLKLSGVPVGKEEESERNLSTYYINGLKQIGYAIPPLSSSNSSPPSSSSTTERPPPPSKIALILTTAIPMTISITLIVSLLAALYYGPNGPGGKAKV